MSFFAPAAVFTVWDAGLVISVIAAVSWGVVVTYNKCTAPPPPNPKAEQEAFTARVKKAVKKSAQEAREKEAAEATAKQNATLAAAITRLEQRANCS